MSNLNPVAQKLWPTDRDTNRQTTKQGETVKSDRLVTTVFQQTRRLVTMKHRLRVAKSENGWPIPRVAPNSQGVEIVLKRASGLKVLETDHGYILEVLSRDKWEGGNTSPPPSPCTIFRIIVK